MAQLTIRASRDLVERVRSEAEHQGRSMNDFVVAVLDAATDPDLAGAEAERLRARLRLAGLLAVVPAGPARPDAAAVAAAGRRAAAGRAASDLVGDGR